MQAICASWLRVAGAMPAVSDRNSGAVLKGFMIGSSEAMVSAIASLKMLPLVTRKTSQGLQEGSIRPNPELPANGGAVANQRSN